MRAIVTVTTKEPTFYLPLWKRHYEPFFDYVETVFLPTSIIGDPKVTSGKVSEAVNNLLTKYDLVMLAEIDEIVVPNPTKYKDLGDYLNRNPKNTKVNGYHVIEMEGDKPLDINKKITDQRKYWLHDDLYDKPLITRVPLIYGDGFHRCNVLMDKDPDLVMFHLRDADINSTRERREKMGLGYNLSDLEERRKRNVLIPDEWRVI